MRKVEMVVGSVDAVSINNERAVILKEKDGVRYIRLWGTADQANAILAGRSKAITSEPLIYDFIRSVIENLEAALKYVIVDTLVQDTFYAKAVLVRKNDTNETLGIVCRPSDALPLALRANVPIFVTDKILMATGFTVDGNNLTMKDAKYIPGEIIVAKSSCCYIDRHFLGMASAVILDNGSRTCSVAVISRELGIPAVTVTFKATKLLVTGQKVIVDGTFGMVYAVLK